MSAHSETHKHHDHHPVGHDHGSYRSYFTGFVLSVILTAVPFAIVMAGGFENRLLTGGVVVGFAAVQILVHMHYFLHMNSKSESGWTMLALLFTVVVVVIILAGSLWVMHNMNTNMMPQMNHPPTGFGS